MATRSRCGSPPRRPGRCSAIRTRSGRCSRPAAWDALKRGGEDHLDATKRFLAQPAGTYTWIPFGGGVRRCLGASFAIFEMKAVLRTIARHIETLTPDRPQSERVTRRAVTLTPHRGARVVAV